MEPPTQYLAVFNTFLRNSLIRDMTFRANFLIQAVSSMTWVFMNLGFYVLIFEYTPMIGEGTGWSKYPFFLYLATWLMINSVVHAFFMSNAREFSEMIRTGTLDFALVKPIDTQFLVSLGRIELASLANGLVGMALLVYSLFKVDYLPGPVQMLLYPFYLACGVAILYSMMISMAAMAVWMGRNLSLFDFWFYITNFSRYPMEIYSGTFGTPLRLFFTFVLPVFIVVNVPARLLVRPLKINSTEDWLLPLFAIVATAGSLIASRWVFKWALSGYRSASS